MNDESDAAYADYVHGRIPALRRVAHLLSGDEHLADDLVQETITSG
jgi:DNA-directed RNA polymerase specialized sigma24 family protein